MTLLEAAVAALQDGGRLVELRESENTFRVLVDDGGEPLVGVVVDVPATVVVYALRPEAVPAARRADLAELVTRMNTGLFASAYELDLDAGVLAHRAALVLGDGLAAVRGPVLTQLLVALVDDLETEDASHAAAVEAVLGGASAHDGLAALAG